MHRNATSVDNNKSMFAPPSCDTGHRWGGESLIPIMFPGMVLVHTITKPFCDPTSMNHVMCGNYIL